jgi:hypothetical protein
MIYLKTNSTGLDRKIELIQRYFDEHLTKDWGAAIEIYGKIYPTIRNGVTVPEVYVGNKEYKSIFINDAVTATIGFEVISREIVYKKAFSEINIICSVNIGKLYPNSREDERALFTFNKHLERCGYVRKEAKPVKEGIKNVFPKYNTDNLIHRDMHPWYVFSIGCTVEYYDNGTLISSSITADNTNITADNTHVTADNT